MTRNFRRLIFWLFVVFFIITSIVMVFFAQGWDFDFNTLRIVKTGGIFIKTSVDGAKIYINDEYIESTGGILSHSRLISNLIPKNYNVFVYKEDYYPWNKIIKVDGGLVTELNHVMLFPLDFKKIKVVELPLQNISDFSVNKDEIIEVSNKKASIIRTYDFKGLFLSTKKIIAATSSLDIISPDKNKKLYIVSNQIWVDYLSDSIEGQLKKSGEKEILATFEPPIKFLDWFGDSEHIIWFSQDALSIAELDNRGGKRNVIKFYLNIDPPLFFDRDSSILYFFEITGKTSILYKINLET